MSDTSTTTLPPAAADQEAEGHGRHRGQVSAEASGAAPHGRHRKPSGQAEQAGTAA
ncbi:hypothetical protein ACFOZ0_25495 [Streptomyces yaanensis]|uniref:Uncharacterized protein n=1 Tax=Streptomyces yaanensis TaxID=1142239 RepID=A0ABV7SI33_9ACTN|nr:hypothetical protein [Streptomyces sp. CGMCC 4.7035]WNC01542.1 hypothetical protein Q2K21_27700 [Streptomyces sp. CGMCC 4.7035]